MAYDGEADPIGSVSCPNTVNEKKGEREFGLNVEEIKKYETEILTYIGNELVGRLNNQDSFLRNYIYELCLTVGLTRQGLVQELRGFFDDEGLEFVKDLWAYLGAIVIHGDDTCDSHTNGDNHPTQKRDACIRDDMCAKRRKILPHDTKRTVVESTTAGVVAQSNETETSLKPVIISALFGTKTCGSSSERRALPSNIGLFNSSSLHSETGTKTSSVPLVNQGNSRLDSDEDNENIDDNVDVLPTNGVIYTQDHMEKSELQRPLNADQKK